MGTVTMLAHGDNRLFQWHRAALSPDGVVRPRGQTEFVYCRTGDTLIRVVHFMPSRQTVWQLGIVGKGDSFCDTVDVDNWDVLLDTVKHVPIEVLESLADFSI